jgi:hypothetical protein
MNFLEGMALILLTLAGYSSGAVIAGRGRSKSLRLLDLGAAALLLILALATRGIIGHWIALPFWFILSGWVAALFTRVKRGEGGTKKEDRKGPVDKTPWRRVWDGWKAFATDMGNYQGRMFFAFFYFIIVMPFGVGLRLFADPFKMKPEGKNTFWLERTPISRELKDAREQF